jgi:Ca-activated chloride channel family protein
VSRRSSGNGAIILLLIVIAVVMFNRRRNDDDADANRPNELDAAVTAEAGAQPREGLAAAIVIDVSGSMNERVKGESGQRKIETARRAAVDLVEQFARYAEDHKGEPVLLGVFEFSDRTGQPDCRVVIPMGPPDRARAKAAIDGMDADGGTPIGTAMITAKKALDATGLSRRHLLVVTDGENTSGPDPEDVAAAIGRRPAEEQPSMYFVAFDISARRFDAVKNAGGLVLEAANATALNDTLDSLLRGKILIER